VREKKWWRSRRKIREGAICSSISLEYVLFTFSCVLTERNVTASSLSYTYSLHVPSCVRNVSLSLLHIPKTCYRYFFLRVYRLWFSPCYVFPLHVRDSPCARNAILLQQHVWLLVWKDLKTEESFRKYVFIIIIITLLKDNNMTKPYSTRRIRRLRCSKTSSKSMSCIICVSLTDFPEPSSVSASMFLHFEPDNDFAIANVHELEILAQSMMGKW
jgi:hypothetical protein